MTCIICGNTHDYKCPLIRAFEYYPDGTLRRTEFITYADLIGKDTSVGEVVYINPAHPVKQ